MIRKSGINSVCFLLQLDPYILFNLHIVNFLFLSSNIPSGPSLVHMVFLSRSRLDMHDVAHIKVSKYNLFLKDKNISNMTKSVWKSILKRQI